MHDECQALVHAARERPRWTALQRWLRVPLERLYLYAETPQDRIERAVDKEIEDLCRRTAHALTDIRDTREPSAVGRNTQPAQALIERALGLLGRGAHEKRFPRHELESLALERKRQRATEVFGSVGEGEAAEDPLLRELGRAVARHQALARRLRWLLNPEVTRAELDRLDPLSDADQIWNFVKYDFRAEWLHVAWGNANKRIVQSLAITTFFHGTGKAERVPVERAEDTLAHYYYFHNWGPDSYHGRTAIENMNRIHGLYFIHNDGLKHVLLNGGLTVLDGLDLMAHRKLTEKERLGYFHATVNMGRAMGIDELSHDYDEMYTWFHELNRAFSDYHPLKRRMWQSIQHNFDRMLEIPRFNAFLRQRLELHAMDDTYLSALGLERPSRAESLLLRSLLTLARKTRACLPGGPYIESLQNFAIRKNGASVEDIGDKHRAASLPPVCPFSGKSLPAGLPAEKLKQPTDFPKLAKEDAKTFSYEEVRRHNKPDDLWVIFNGHVHDVSSFARNHPGGLKILLNSVGKDMTETFQKANHSDLAKAFTLNFRIGKIEAELPEHPSPDRPPPDPAPRPERNGKERELPDPPLAAE